VREKTPFLMKSIVKPLPLLLANIGGTTTCLSSLIVFLSRVIESIERIADPDPSDPYVFEPPGSGYGSSNQRYGSGSGSFYHQAKIVRKTMIPTVLSFFF
jgi:hypothetical protein